LDNKGRKGRKGVSTLVATVLILAVAVTLVSVVAAWSTGYLDTLLGRAGVMISIENVYFINITNPGEPVDLSRINMTIMNKGSSKTDIAAIFIDDKRINNWNMTVDSTNTDSLEQNQIGEIQIFLNSGDQWEPQTSYTLKIATSGYFQVSKEVISPNSSAAITT